jgi:hypothetical protein
VIELDRHGTQLALAGDLAGHGGIGGDPVEVVCAGIGPQFELRDDRERVGVLQLKRARFSPKLVFSRMRNFVPLFFSLVAVKEH